MGDSQIFDFAPIADFEILDFLEISDLGDFEIFDFDQISDFGIPKDLEKTRLSRLKLGFPGFNFDSRVLLKIVRDPKIGDLITIEDLTISQIRGLIKIGDLQNPPPGSFPFRARSPVSFPSVSLCTPLLSSPAAWFPLQA